MNKDHNVLMTNTSIIPHTYVYKLDVANQLKAHGSSTDTVSKPVILRCIPAMNPKQLVNVLIMRMSTSNIPLTKTTCLTEAHVKLFLIVLQELSGIHIVSNVCIENPVRQEKFMILSKKGVYGLKKNRVNIPGTIFMMIVLLTVLNLI